eukprot:symbB.v1.2.008279.t1/scaffold519.1/size192877/7
MLSVPLLASFTYGIAYGLECANDPETWDYVRYLNDISAVNPLPREGRELLYDLYKTWGSPRRTEDLQNLAKCASG